MTGNSNTAAGVLLACLLVVGAHSPSFAQELSAREDAYVSELALSFGPNQSATATTLQEGGRTFAKGVQVTFPGFQVDRLRFRTPEEAQSYAQNLGSGDFVQVRGNQVLHASGERLPDARRLEQAGWSVLPSKPVEPNANQRDAQPKDPARDADRSAPPRSRPAPTQDSTTVPASTPRGTRNGADQFLRHHLLGEDLPEESPGSSPPGQDTTTPDGATTQGDEAEPEMPETDQALRDMVDMDIEAQRAEVGDYLTEQAKDNFDALSEEDRLRFVELLQRHDSDLARSRLIKGLASANTVDDLEWLSDEMTGKSDEWIRGNTDLTSENALTQQFGHSCAPTVAQALRGELDPVYALRMRQSGDLHAVDTMDPYANNEPVAMEQRTLLEGAGGSAFARDADGGEGVDDANYEALVDGSGAHAGIDYEATPSGRWRATRVAEAMDASLGQGIPVPLKIYRPGFGAHAVLALERREDASGVSYQIYEPWYGTLTWVPRSDIVNHTVDVNTGQPNVALAFTPRGAVEPAPKPRRGK